MKSTTRILPIIISIILVVSVVLVIYYKTRPTMYGGSYYEGTGIHINDPNPIYFDDFNLSDASDGNITNDTFTLEIRVSTITENYFVYYNYHIYTNTGNFSLLPVNYSNKSIYIATNNTNINYSFQIRWLINSTDSSIANLKLLGNDNVITGNFRVYDNWNLNLTLDNQYIDICTLGSDYSTEKYVMLPYNQKIEFYVIILCVG
jgi:hypothetical protein